MKRNYFKTVCAVLEISVGSMLIFTLSIIKFCCVLSHFFGNMNL
jgi:hypothetical protein